MSPPGPSPTAIRLSTPSHLSLLTSSIPSGAETLPRSLPPHALSTLSPSAAALLLPSLRGISAARAAREVPPRVLRPHWLGLARAHAAALKARPRAADAAALAALIAAAAPYPALGGPALPAVAAVASSALAYVRRALLLAASTVAPDGASGDKTDARDGEGANAGASADASAEEPAEVEGDTELDARESAKLVAEAESGAGQKEALMTEEAHLVAVLAIGLAVAEVSPQQWRRSQDAKLEGALWALVERSYSRDIREGAAALLAALPACQPQNSRADAMGGTLSRASSALLSLSRAFAAFRPGAAPEELLGPDAAQEKPEMLVSRFEGLCDVLCACVSSGLSEAVAVPVGDVLDAVSHVLTFVAVDPFMPEKGNVGVVSVASILPLWRLAALNALTCVVSALGRPAVLPHAHRVSAAVASVLSSSIHVAGPHRGEPQRMQSSAGLAERAAAYCAALTCVTTLGSPAVEALVPALHTCLSVDLPMAVSESVNEGRGVAPKTSALNGIDAHARRPRKRQRVGWSLDNEESRAGKESFSSPDYDPAELHVLTAAPLAFTRVRATISGLAVVEAIFACRCFLSLDAVRTLSLIEQFLVSAIFAQGDLCRAVIRTVSACILSGGCGRIDGHATPISDAAHVALKKLLSRPGLGPSIVMDARNALASCEALIHTRGPSILSSALKNPSLKALVSSKTKGPSASDMFQSLQEAKLKREQKETNAVNGDIKGRIEMSVNGNMSPGNEKLNRLSSAEMLQGIPDEEASRLAERAGERQETAVGSVPEPNTVHVVPPGLSGNNANVDSVGAASTANGPDRAVSEERNEGAELETLASSRIETLNAPTSLAPAVERGMSSDAADVSARVEESDMAVSVKAPEISSGPAHNAPSPEGQVSPLVESEDRGGLQHEQHEDEEDLINSIVFEGGPDEEDCE